MDFIKNIQGYEYAIVFLIVVLGYVVKGFLPLKGKLKNLFMLLPFVFSFIISIALYLFLDVDKNYIVDKGFLWGAGGIILYDVFLEKINNFGKDKNDTNKTI